jgi:hypothetical protein
MKYVVDIDGTICESNGGYPNAVPYMDRIAQINGLYDQGHTVVYWTARGGNSGLDWSELTAQQLEDWGCKHHGLMMNKPAYDVWVDDKAQWLF